MVIKNDKKQAVMKLSVVQARTHFLKIIEKLQKTPEEIVITKRGVPVAKLVPLGGEKSRLGLGRGLGKTLGEIVENDGSEEWEALG
jgi:prevent-host-death family protein